MSDQDGDLPEMNDGPPAENEPLSACPIDPEERLDTERVLGLFAPRTPRLKRERLLALVAGVRREVEPRSNTAVRYRTPWYWPTATGVMTASSIALAVVLAVRVSGEPPVQVEYREKIVFRNVVLPSTPSTPTLVHPAQEKVEAVVTVPQPGTTGTTETLIAPPPGDYLRSRSIALSQGVDGLDYRQPAAVRRVPPNSPATRDELLRELGPTKPLRSVTSPSMQTGMTKSWIWPSW